MGAGEGEPGEPGPIEVDPGRDADAPDRTGFGNSVPAVLYTGLSYTSWFCAEM